MTSSQVIEYRTSGTCSKALQVELEGDIIKSAKFFGGCPGNLEGIQNLIVGMSISQVVEKLKGIKCGDKPTSCPDQLAQCLLKHKSQVGQVV